jgi:hypothetical protein
LKIKKIFAKNDFKLDEHEVDEDYIIKDEKYLLANHNDLLPQVILDVENHNEYYPLDTKYSLNQSEIDERIEENLHKTKSYKKLLKQNERFASVVQNQINVVLIPIARIHLGKYEELVNAANGEIDVIYELSKKVTSQLKKGKWIYLPSVIIFVIFAAVSLAILIFAQDLGVQFLFKESKVWLPLRNFSGYLYFILLFFGIIFALIGIPSRKNIVKRITNNKDSLTILKNASFFLYGIDIGLIIFFFLLLPYLF